MKKRLVFILTIGVLMSLIVVTPSSAFSNIAFNIRDDVTGQPWCTSPGQSYRIVIWGNSSGTLLDTGTISTPLNYSCSFGSTCGGSALGTPTTIGETVSIYMIFTGTLGIPATKYKSYLNPPFPLGTFTINETTGTGPNAVTLADTGTESPNVWLAVALGVVALVGVGGGALLLRRRRIA